MLSLRTFCCKALHISVAQVEISSVSGMNFARSDKTNLACYSGRKNAWQVCRLSLNANNRESFPYRWQYKAVKCLIPFVRITYISRQTSLDLLFQDCLLSLSLASISSPSPSSTRCANESLFETSAKTSSKNV